MEATAACAAADWVIRPHQGPLHTGMAEQEACILVHQHVMLCDVYVCLTMCHCVIECRCVKHILLAAAQLGKIRPECWGALLSCNQIVHTPHLIIIMQAVQCTLCLQ